MKLEIQLFTYYQIDNEVFKRLSRMIANVPVTLSFLCNILFKFFEIIHIILIWIY